MAKICNHEAAAKRQESFQNALLEMMQKTPYKKIYVSQLCDKVGVSRKTFYKYFESMDDLLQSVIMEELRKGKSWCSMNEIPDIALYFDYWRSRSDFLDLLAKNDLLFQLVEQSYSNAFAKYHPDSKDYHIANATMMTLLAGTVFMVCIWYMDGMRQSSEEMADIINQHFHFTEMPF